VARLVIITGKGGVGRSALAAALAIRAARTGRRTLAIAASDGHGLAAHLSLDALGYTPHEARDALWAMVVEPGTALEEYLQRSLHLPILPPAGRALRVLAETVPGIRDTVVIGKILAEADAGEWDAVVVDGPPTGQIASHLAAPATIRRLIPSGRVRRQAAWMQERLADPAATELIVLATPEELPVEETREALAELGGLEESPPISVSTVVCNRVLSDPGFGPADIPSDASPPVRGAARLHLELRAAQSSWKADLDPAVELPFLLGVRTPAEVAARLADLWPLESP
jgi:anion-transporting  ArsA/GET3 family ATPase